MKEISVLTVKLLLICAIVSALLAGVNSITKPIIAENEQKNFEIAMQEVLPEASGFEEVALSDYTPSETGVILDSLYQADNGGYVVSTVCSEGYGGDVSVMVGITKDLAVNQVKIMSMSETPGLGAKASEPEFIGQYDGLSAGIAVVKNTTPADNQIEAISGATITSKAVTKAVNTALEAAEKVNTSKGGAAQ
ncbi:MAG: RnfABCDGE type electron transport complex subunit G [Clostridia bacterium]|nr:RnfABCDGE type electron transport complex subunit G [Clostridia bacterium]